jgi:XTP/dITP diphosphohydrolase
MVQLLLASNNKGKLVEMQSLLADTSFQLLLLQDVGVRLAVEESGSTYAENAALKARAGATASGLITLADDSGLEVAALGGRPGLYSARYSQKPGASDADRRAFLLRELDLHEQPWFAYFRCTVAIATPASELYFSEGECHGEIIPEERGQNGFGYDPIFFIPHLGRTMAELSTEEKNRISHRAMAMMNARLILTELITGKR